MRFKNNAFALVFAVIVIALCAWGANVLTGPDQEATWAAQVRNEEHPKPSMEQLLRAARREHAVIKPQTLEP